MRLDKYNMDRSSSDGLHCSAPFPLAGPMPAWRSVFAWFALVPLILAALYEVNDPAAEVDRSKHR